MTTAGKSMTGIRRVVVWRATEELPVSQPPREPGDVDPTSRMPSSSSRKFRRSRLPSF